MQVKSCSSDRTLRSSIRGVAQPGRALRSGRIGRRFKSCLRELCPLNAAEVHTPPTLNGSFRPGLVNGAGHRGMAAVRGYVAQETSYAPATLAPPSFHQTPRCTKSHRADTIVENDTEAKSSSMRAVELFELLASTAWRTILRANRNRISFGEDAITSINLNAIASLNDTCVAVEDSRVDEARKGCDFEMWIGSDVGGWRRYAVQAKKITVNTWRYEKLNHKVRGRSQIDILKQYALKAHAAPIYCFYNFAPHIVSWNCAMPPDASQLGCMVVPAGVVEQAMRLRGCKHFGWMHIQAEAIPWRCLLTCPPSHHHKGAVYAPLRWPHPETYHHKTLPEELQAIRDEPSTAELIEPAPLSPGDESLLPRWTVVVDTGPADQVEIVEAILR